MVLDHLLNSESRDRRVRHTYNSIMLQPACTAYANSIYSC